MPSKPWCKAIWRLAVVWVLLAALVLSCAPPAPTPEPVTIRFAHPSVDADYYRSLATRFSERYPWISVQLLPMGWNGLDRLRAGDADVFVTHSEHDLRQQGDILSLDPWIAHDEAFDRADYYPGILELFAAEGKTWAIPAWLDPTVMYYNKDLFDQRHIPYPQNGWTWDDFLVAAQALSDPEAGIYGYAYPPYGADYWLFVEQHGGELVDDFQNPTRLTLDDPKAVEALEWYAQLIHVHHVAPTPEEARQAFGGGDGNCVALGVRAGMVGMWTGAHSERGGAWGRSPWSFRWGVVSLPREAQAATWVAVDRLAISSGARHPDACWQWVSFLSQEVTSGLVPARRSVLGSSAYEKQVGAEVAAADRAALQGALQYWPSGSSAPNDLGLGVLQEAVLDVYYGRATVREALSRAQLEVDR